MHVNRGLLGWGVFFIALGVVPLAVQGGAVDASIARRAWELWPLLLIGAGLGLALRSSALDFVGGIVVAVTFGLMAGGLVAGGFGGPTFGFCGNEAAAVGAPGQPLTGTLGASAGVDLTVDCGALTVSSRPGSQWSIVWPAGNGRDPQVKDASTGHLGVEFGAHRGFGITDPSATWDMQLPADPATALNITVNAGSARLSLGGAHVGSLAVSVNAGDAHLDLAGALNTSSLSGSVNAGSLSVALPTPSSTLSGSLSANAGSVAICAPAGVPLRIHVGDHPLGSTNLDQRNLVHNGNTWTRGAWDTAQARIDLDVSANLGSVTLDPEGGCG